MGFAREAWGLQKPEFVTGIVAAAKARNLRVLADHVQTQDDLQLARDFGSDPFRGNLSAQAMPYLKMIEWLSVNL